MAASTGVAGAELNPLPVFFQQSWEMVRAQPLTVLSKPQIAVPEAKSATPASAEPIVSTASAPALGHLAATRSISTLTIPIAPEDGGTPGVPADAPRDATNVVAQPAASEAAAAYNAQPAPVPVAPQPVVGAPAVVSASVPNTDAPAVDPAAPEANAPPGAAPSGPVAMASADVAVPPVRPGADAAGQPAAKPDVPVTLNVPKTVEIRDRSSFMIGKTLYRLASTDGLGVNTHCTPEKGKGCYWRPMRSLKVAIAGSTLICRPAGGGAWSCSKKQGAQAKAGARR